MLKYIIFILLISAFPAYALDCPDNFLEQLNGDNLTDLQKTNLGKTCQGQTFDLFGTVRNVTLDPPGKPDGATVIHLDTIGEKYKTIRIIMSKEPGCDLGKINKGQPLSIKAKMDRFLGFSNHYIEAVDGTCH